MAPTLSHTISFQEFVPIPSSLSLLPLLSKFPSQQLRLESLIRTEKEHIWYADNLENAEVLFAVGKLTGTINPFMENEESFSKALDKIVIITNEGEEIKRSKFAAVVARFVPLLIEKLSNLGFEIIYSNEEVFQTHISRKDNLKLDGDTNGVESLKEEDAPEIAKYWKYAKTNPGAIQYIEHLIKTLPCGGIRDKESGELVAWALTHIDCHIGIVHTKENFRKKGYAKRVMTFLSLEFAKSGRVPHVVIATDNTASIALFNALGFIPDGVDMCWVGCK